MRFSESGDQRAPFEKSAPHVALYTVSSPKQISRARAVTTISLSDGSRGPQRRRFEARVDGRVRGLGFGGPGWPGVSITPRTQNSP